MLIFPSLPVYYNQANEECLNEKYIRFRVGRNLSDMFLIKNGLKEGDYLPPLIFNFVVGYAILRVQVNQDGLKLNGTHQLLVYVDDVNILGGSAHAIQENAEALVVASKEIGLEVNADKTKYMIMSRDQNAGHIRNMKFDNNSFESVEKFKYLGTDLTHQNSIREGIKSKLKSLMLSIIRCIILCLPVCYPKT